MAEFLTTAGTSYHIENIIIEAKSNLILVSPYLQISKTFYERLKDASNKGVSIKIIYGKDELKPNERNSLSELKRVELFYFENLHAKCYFNESQMVITSMNMYEFSEKNNREMGVLINSVHDKVLYERAVAEAFSILESSEHIPLVKSKRSLKGGIVKFGQIEKSSTSSVGHGRGYCIRCESRIDYNPERPLCSDCYNIWAQFANYDYQESVCHRCGEYELTTMAKPQCNDCYWKWNYE